MATFQYQAYGARGELATGSVEAATVESAGELLWTQGLTAFELAPTGTAGRPWWQRELFTNNRLGPADRAAFTREFATLNAADIPLDDALRILAEQATSVRLRNLAAGLLADVLNGASLSNGLQRQAFPADYVSVVMAGETGGSLGAVFSELADLLDRRLEVRARLQTALVYPAMLVTVTVISLSIVLGFLVPSIAPIFSENGQPMPTALGLLVAVGARWPEILGACAVAAAITASGFFVLLRRPHGRIAFDRWILRLPICGTFILRRETASFVRTLGTLLKAGVPLLQAAVSARSVIANRYLGSGLDAAIDSIREGRSLHRALRKSTALPTLALQMIAVGEEASKLDQMLIRVAGLFEQQSQRGVERLMSVLTPILTLSIAALVGGLIMTVINAILGMNELVYR